MTRGSREGEGSGPGAAADHLPGGPDGDTRAELLNRVARQIDFPAWLVTQGFHVSPVQRDVTRLAFSNRYGEMISLQKDPETRTWSYETTGQPLQRGTLVDLLQREGSTPDECLERLASCLDPSNRNAEPTKYRQALTDRDQSLGRAVARHVQAVALERTAERDLKSLGVVAGTFDRWRFGSAAAVLIDPPDLGHSRSRLSDQEVVILERPIDAIAYERVHGHQLATYIYTGDHPSDEAKRKLARVLADAPRELRIVAAFGRDGRGARLAAELVRLAGDRPVERRPPEFGGRWSDQMQIEHRHRQSLDRLHRGPDFVMQRIREQIARALDSGVDQAAIRTAVIGRAGQGRGPGLDR